MDNTLRALRGVISVSGWIAEFDETNAASVHVDAIFREGSFGGAEDAKVRFKLSLKRAEIFLCIPGEEPIQIIRKSIRRVKKESPGRRTRKREIEYGASAAGSLGIGMKSLSGGAEVSSKAQLRGSMSEEAEEEVREYFEQHIYDDSERPGWEFRRCDGGPLRGAPLDAEDEPVAKVRRSAERNADGSRPTLKVEIRCRREDLHIDELEAKDKGVQQIFNLKRNRDANLAAAEQIIKDEIAKAGFLEVPNLEEGQSQILVADVIITEDV